MQQATMIKIPVDKIMAITDRKHGGQGDIEALARSIEEHGLIQPPAVKEIEDRGFSRVIAGRRRVEAIKLLGWGTVRVTVYPDDSEEEAIALAENVNRDEMHPLDEAETFRRLMDEGQSVDEIALYYNRSTSAIYHRIRLTYLIDGIRTMFRNRQINISGAALIASLPEEDQEKFLKKYDGKEVNRWDVTSFLHSVQKLKLEHIADEECEKCKKRTHNTEPGLFEEFNSLEDVCFDGDCYARKWLDRIEGLIEGVSSAMEGETEANIILDDMCLPDFLPPNTRTVNIAGIDYALLADDDYISEPTDKKDGANTAWYICLDDNGESGPELTAYRVEYKKDDPVSRNSDIPDVESYMIDRLPEIREEDREAVAAKLEDKYQSYWRLKNKIKEELLEAIVDKRVAEGSSEHLAAEWLASRYSGNDKENKPCGIDPKYGHMVAAIFGLIESFAEIPKDPLLQKVFTFIVATGLHTHSLPDLDDDDDEWEEKERSLFWKFAGLTREEYVEMYRDRLSKAVAEVNGIAEAGGEK